MDSSLTTRSDIIWKERKRGGHLGLIFTEHANIAPDSQGWAHANMLSIGTDEHIETHRKIVDVIHSEGTPVCIQLNHAGSATSTDITGRELVSASPVDNPGKQPKFRAMTNSIPHELTKEEILRIEDFFCRAAVRAKKAGYDAVEIHSAHAYLLNQFYSPVTNKRTDEYGSQSVENRVRIHVEIIRKIRAALGDDYPLFLRLGACDYMEGGSTVEDAVEAAKIFEKEGVDVLDISGGMCLFAKPPTGDINVYFTQESAAVKAAVSIPVIVTGGISSLDQAESQLERGCADLIGVGRALLKDPQWMAAQRKTE